MHPERRWNNDILYRAVGKGSSKKQMLGCNRWDRNHIMTSRFSWVGKYDAEKLIITDAIIFWTERSLTYTWGLGCNFNFV